MRGEAAAGCAPMRHAAGRQPGAAIGRTVGVAGLLALTTLVALVVGAGRGTLVAAALAHPGAAQAPPADERSVSSPRGQASPRRAPSGPPLNVGGEEAADAGTGGERTAASPQGEVDPLVSNGLGSPLCRGVLGWGELTAAARRHCETSGFVAAAAPTGDYGIDVHIDTGVLGLSSGGLLSTVQDLFVTPLWMALVWGVHALIVMLEWCFAIDLLDSSAASGVGAGLRRMQASFTEPWLALVLAVAAVLALYDGLIRRRVAETVGQALLMGAMMVGGLWVIADPMGTVGALGRWANQASLGTLAVAARGSPARPGSVLADSMDAVFADAIEVPWCYLEFGDVGWCRNRAELDPRLHAAGLRMAAEELTQIGCKLGSGPFSPCAAGGSTQARSLEHSAELLREAQSNGAIFLALPANGPARNSINEPGSLLRAICQSSEATSCRGSTAAQAEFRTNGGTWSRVGGLLLIAAGILGMALLLGFIALRLLAAAIFSLLYLLLAPAMVLAPALGDGGRGVFRRWAAQLLGAVVSKLLFSFLLGVVLAVVAILSELEGLGWWTQWLLMSAFWWGAYARRHQALGVAQGVVLGKPDDRPNAGQRSIARRVGDALDSPRRAVGAARWTVNRLTGPAPGVGHLRRHAQTAREPAKAGDDEQVTRVLAHARRDAVAGARAAPEIRRRLASERTRLERLERERSDALARGNRRRVLELEHRGQRVRAEIERDQLALVRSSGGFSRRQAQERGRFLDEQAGLPAASTFSGRSQRGGRPSQRRDYAALAGLAGLGREQYEHLDPGARRAARLQVDRELASRRELRIQDRAQSPPAARREAPRVEHALGSGHVERRPGGERESSVMRDAREVAARRKRQLGRDRP